jgi:two-component system response regulator VicR
MAMPDRLAVFGEAPGFDLDLFYGVPERQRILIIDDETDTVFLLKEILKSAGFDVVGAFNCDQALEKASDFTPDVILLDLMMPDIDGWETYQQLRKMTEAPVVVISAKSTKEDVVNGLQGGVDDYITKPFHNAEVVARVRNVLRRAGTPDRVSRLTFNQIDLTIHLDTKEVLLAGKSYHLTGKEFALMVLLARHAPGVVTYETIANEIWNEDTPATRNRIKYLVYLLRHKLEMDPEHPQLIVNSGRNGYRLQSVT